MANKRNVAFLPALAMGSVFGAGCLWIAYLGFRSFLNYVKSPSLATFDAVEYLVETLLSLLFVGILAMCSILSIRIGLILRKSESLSLSTTLSAFKVTKQVLWWFILPGLIYLVYGGLRTASGDETGWGFKYFLFGVFILVAVGVMQFFIKALARDAFSWKVWRKE